MKLVYKIIGGIVFEASEGPPIPSAKGVEVPPMGLPSDLFVHFQRLPARPLPPIQLFNPVDHIIVGLNEAAAQEATYQLLGENRPDEPIGVTPVPPVVDDAEPDDYGYDDDYEDEDDDDN